MVGTLDTLLNDISITVATAATVFILFVTCIAVLMQNKTETVKKILFAALFIAIVVPTIFFVGSTVYINLTSETGGPVHWHADFEIYACGQPVKLTGPTSRLSNKVGTPVFHHHDDNRIHIEGVVMQRQDFELQDFFATIGGELTNTSFSIPTESGIRQIPNGTPCADTQTGTWQVFIYQEDKTDPKIFRQQKLTSYTDYIFSPHQQIPPGDCIIMEFDVNKARTDHLCPLYKVESEKGNIVVQ